MKSTRSKKTTQACKRQIVDAFGGKLPTGYGWTRSKDGSVITWSLEDRKKKVIAKVRNTGKTRTIDLEEKVFRISDKKNKRKASKKKTTTTTTTSKKTTKTVANPRKRRKKNQQFPPPFKPSASLLDRLAERYEVHENPDPPDCETCGMKYGDLRTGLDFKSVQDMLFTDSSDSSLWRQKGRSSVLGLWFELKRNLWDEHTSLCGDEQGQEDWLDDFKASDFEEY